MVSKAAYSETFTHSSMLSKSPIHLFPSIATVLADLPRPTLVKLTHSLKVWTNVGSDALTDENIHSSLKTRRQIINS